MPASCRRIATGLAVAAAALSAGCAPRDRAPAAPAPAAAVWRDASAVLSSSTRFDPLRFSGRWYEVASFRAPGTACAVGAVTYTVQKGGLVLITEGPCDDAAPAQRLARVTGPGRLNHESGAQWVLWVDDDFRTAVIGSPDGRTGWILDRSRSIPRDRLAAAREILAFNGYDLSRLQETAP